MKKRNKTIDELQEDYDLNLDKIVETVAKEKVKEVLLQFPDALKIYSDVILDYLEKNTKGVNYFIWLGSCFGACDLPNVDEEDFDLIIQFGHSKWGYHKKDNIEEL